MKVVLFWSEYGGETILSEWLKREVYLSPSQLLTIQSHNKFGSEFELYSYQKIKNFSKTRDANDILPARIAFQMLVNGHSIAHISDYVRMTVSARDSGIVMDLDTIILRELPNESFYTSIPARTTGAFAVKFNAPPHLPLYVADGSWDGKALANFPMGVDSKNSRYVKRLAEKTYGFLMKPPKKTSAGWNFVMWQLGKMTYYDRAIKTYAPLYFGVVPGWLGKKKCYSIQSPTKFDGKTELFGYRFPSIDEILSNSYAVQHYYESAFKGSTKLAFNFEDLPKDCLLYNEYKYINS